MPIALTDEHEAQRRSVRGGSTPTARRACPGPCSTPRRRSSSRCGRRWPPRAGWDPPARGVRGSGFGLVRAGRPPRRDGPGAGPRPAPAHRGHLDARGRGAPRRRPTCAARAHRRQHAGRPLLGEACSSGGRRADGRDRVSGSLRPLLGAATASVVLAPARRDDGAVIWCLLDVPGSGDGCRSPPLASLDPTRRVGVVEVDGPGGRRTGSSRRSPPSGCARWRWP